MWPMLGADAAKLMGMLPPPSVATQTFEALVAWPARVEGPILVFVIDEDMVPFAAEASQRGAWVIGYEPLRALVGMNSSRLSVVNDPLGTFRNFAREFGNTLPCPVVAVGGSNGKTTTKDLIAAALSPLGHVVCTRGTNNGWAGVPTTLTRHELRRDNPPKALVVEVGIDEVGAMASHMAILRPDVAVLTCLGPEHLAGLKDHETCVREELGLFQAPRRVWLADEPALRARLHEAHANDAVVTSTPLGPEPSCVTHTFVVERESPTGQSVRIAQRDAPAARLDLSLVGSHNARNAALAFAVARLLGVPAERAASALAACEPPKQRARIEHLGSGCMLIDDTYNASPSSVRAALGLLALFPHREPLVILGDMLDLGAYTEAEHLALVPLLRLLGKHSVMLCGPAMASLAGALGDRVHALPPPGITESNGVPSDLYDRVVLVKGSRGMHMERWAERIRQAEAHADQGRPAMCVLGRAREEIARHLRDALGQRVAVSAVDAGHPLCARASALLLWDFEAEGADPEAELAQMVQPLLQAPAHVALMLGGSETMDLVAEVTDRRAERLCASSAEEFARAAVDGWLRLVAGDQSITTPER
jgi:UDP-N-acetylmuramoyl-tripeptide--D-alanyl-D-alanine ligase